MIAYLRLTTVALVVLLGGTFIGCGGRSGGAVQETEEFTFDDIAAAAAAETAEAEEGPQ